MLNPTHYKYYKYYKYYKFIGKKNVILKFLLKCSLFPWDTTFWHPTIKRVWGGRTLIRTKHYIGQTSTGRHQHQQRDDVVENGFHMSLAHGPNFVHAKRSNALITGQHWANAA